MCSAILPRQPKIPARIVRLRRPERGRQERRKEQLKFFLGTILAGEELNVIDQQCIQRSVHAFEHVDRIVLERPDHVADETLGVNIRNSSLRLALTLHALRIHEAQYLIALRHFQLEFLPCVDWQIVRKDVHVLLPVLELAARP